MLILKYYFVCSKNFMIGVHSGDATHVVPPHTVSSVDEKRAREIVSQVVSALNISGPFNVQLLLCANGSLKVIEAK